MIARLRALAPKSLAGQMALLLAAVLVAAQLVNAAVIVSERRRAALNESVAPSAARFADEVARALSTEDAADFDLAAPRAPWRGHPPRRGRDWRYWLAAESAVESEGLSRARRLERRLTRAMAADGVDIAALHVAIAPRSADAGAPLRPQFEPPDAADPPQPRNESMRRESHPGGPRFGGRGPPPWTHEVRLSAELPDGRWLNARFPARAPMGGDALQLAASSLVLIGFVVAAALWLARRLARPLGALAAAAQSVGEGDGPARLDERGPEEVRRTMAAFNAMSDRVSGLLEEKDVMLGALGHDLRTPLTSLRVMLEQMEPADARARCARTIEEASQLLEDILELARAGHDAAPVEPYDVSALVEDLAEDYAAMGAEVAAEANARAIARCRPAAIRRLLRNLVDNALKHGGAARIKVVAAGDELELRVEDDGPGVPPDQLEAVLRPFARAEGSRNRATGGAGLGLAIADAIARAHGGRLTLENRAPQGLSARVTLPRAT